MNTLNQIIESIENHKLLEFNYDGYFRVVEPHTVGISKTGKESLSAFQIDGDSNRGTVPCWGQFTVSKIENLIVLNDEFNGERPGYTKGDSRMDEILAEV
jgi:hypothetical protein